MAWFSEERISMNYLICNGLLQECELSSDSDEPKDEVVRVNFEVKENTHLVKSSDKMNVQAKKEVAGKDEADKIDFCFENGDKIEVCVKVEDKVNGQVKEEVAEKDLVQNNDKVDDHINMEVEMNDSRAKNVGRKPASSGSDVSRKMKSQKLSNCHHCSFTTTRGFNLRRHVQRNHGDDNVQSHESGGCICLECGHKCFLIKDLREHLIKSHGFMFRIINKEFQDLSGRTYLLFSIFF